MHDIELFFHFIVILPGIMQCSMVGSRQFGSCSVIHLLIHGAITSNFPKSHSKSVSSFICSWLQAPTSIMWVSRVQIYWVHPRTLPKSRALHPSKLDIGYCQKVADIVNLKSGYWILPTENVILGYWVHWNLDIGTLVSPQLSAFAAAGAEVGNSNILKSGYGDIGPPGAGP